MWPSLNTVLKLNKPTPTTLSTSVKIYPPVQVPSDGRPVPSIATTQRRRAGCRTQSRPERGDDDRFWKSLLKQESRMSCPPRGRAQQEKPGKRRRPTSPSTLQRESWLRTDQAAQKSNKENHHHPAHADAPMGRSQGKRRLMSPAACVNFHPFTETLREWEEGVPVDCGEDWTLDQIEAAIAQGPHQSAMTPESLELITEDIAYQVRVGYAEIVEWAWLKANLPAQLKISPLTVAPQANRCGRMILDLSFPVLRQDKQKRGTKRKRAGEARAVLRESVNDSTIWLAPEAPVKELGNVLNRLL